MVELGRIKRAIDRKKKLEDESASRKVVHAENREKLDALLKKYDPEVEMKEPYWSREDLDEAERLRSALTQTPVFEGAAQMNLFGANNDVSMSISLGWQTLPLLKQIAIVDGKISEQDQQLARQFDARRREEVEEVLKIRVEREKLLILRWNLVQTIAEMLGIEAQELNVEITRERPEKVRLELQEKLKPYGSKPRTKEDGIGFGGPKLE